MGNKKLQINRMKKFIPLLFLLLAASSKIFAQDNLLKLVDSTKPINEYVTHAFKSSRVINGHSIEMIPKGNMDFRILHRFGLISTGIKNLYGLDQANMRLGFDYGLTTNLTVEIGRSNVNKELDGFIKFRPLRQSVGPKPSPVSIVLIAGMTLTTMPWTDPSRDNHFSSRLAYFGEVIVGRRFSEVFSLQLA